MGDTCLPPLPCLGLLSILPNETSVSATAFSAVRPTHILPYYFTTSVFLALLLSIHVFLIDFIFRAVLGLQKKWLFYYFILVQVQLSAFPPHLSTPPQP